MTIANSERATTRFYKDPTPSGVLVTDGEQRAALAVVRSLGSAGQAVHVASARKKSLAGGSRFAASEHLVPNPLTDPAGFVTRVRTLAHEFGVSTIMPISEPALMALLPERETFGKINIPFPDLETFVRINDKATVLEAAKQMGIATPAQHVVSSPADAAALDISALHYPIVVKPTRSVSRDAGEGQGRAKFSVAHAATPDELRTILQSMDPRAFPLLLQQRIVGPGIGIFVLLWDGELVAAFSHRRLREKPPSGGVSVYRESYPLDPTLLERSRALLDASGWNGVAMVEYKVDAATNVPYLMEINGRFWGSLQLAIDAGVDFPTLLLQAANSEHPAPVTSYRTDVRSRWRWGDFDHLIARLLHSPQKLALPPGAPSRMGALYDFFRYDVRDRDEIWRAKDVGPFWRETKEWIQQVL